MMAALYLPNRISSLRKTTGTSLVTPYEHYTMPCRVGKNSGKFGEIPAPESGHHDMAKHPKTLSNMYIAVEMLVSLWFFILAEV